MNGMKKTVLFLLLGGALLFMDGCKTDKTGTDDNNQQPQAGTGVYIAGYTRNSDTGRTYVPCLWKDGQRTDLSVNGKDNSANSVVVANNDVFIAGHAGLSACLWKNGQRTDYSGLTAQASSSGNSVYVFGSDVYVAGSSRDASNIEFPCIWKNGKITALSVYDVNYGGSAGGVFLSGGHVYVSGYSGTSSIDQVPCYWVDGMRIDLMGATVTGENNASAIFVSNGDIYVAGYYRYYQNYEYSYQACYWKNGVLIDLSMVDSFLAKYGRASSIFISGNDVFIAGFSRGNSGIYIPCYWKNGVRSDLSVDSAEGADGGRADSIFIAGTDIFVSGCSGHLISDPCYWKNGERTDLSMIVNPSHGTAAGLSIFVVNN